MVGPPSGELNCIGAIKLRIRWLVAADSPSTVRIYVRPRVHPFRSVSRHFARFKPCRCLDKQNLGPGIDFLWRSARRI
jgi:hypothetical protein